MTKQRRLAGLVVVAIAGLGSACSSASPSSIFGSLSIQGPVALRIGESTRFRVMRIRKDGSQEEALGQWSVTGPYMTVQAANGMALAGSPGIAELRVSVDGIAAVQAVRVVPDMRGTWSGTIEVSCMAWNVSRIGQGPSNCGKTPTLDWQTSVQVEAQSGDIVTGRFAIGNSLGQLTSRVGIDGTWDWAEFTATHISSHGNPYSFDFKTWRLTSQMLGAASGAGRLEWRHTNAWGPQHLIFEVGTVTLRR